MYNYYCKSCGKAATKPSVKDNNGSLGTWRCEKCGVTKVKREKRKDD